MITKANNPIIVCTVTVDKPIAKVTDVLTYTATVVNRGSVNTTNVIFTDILPDNTSFENGSLTVDSATVGDTLSGVNLGNISPNTTKVIAFKAKVNFMPDVNPIINSSYVTYNSPQEISNKSFTSTIVEFPHITAIYNIVIQKQLYSTINIFVKIINDGNIIANNVNYTTKQTINLPIINRPYLNSGLIPNSSPNIGSIKPGEKATVAIVGDVPKPPFIGAGCSSAIGEVTANFNTYQGQVTNTYESNVVTAQILTNIEIPLQTVNTDIAAPGDIIEFNITIYGGITNYKNVVFRDILPPQIEYVVNSFKINGILQSAPIDLTNGVNINDINVGTNKQVSYAVKVNESFPHYINNFEHGNIITGVGDGNFITGPNVVSIFICKYSLIIYKIINNLNVKVGDEITCVILVENGGNWEAQDVMLTDYIPSGLSFIPKTVVIDSISKESLDPTVGINLESIDAHDIVNIQFNLKVDFVPINPIVSTMATATANFKKEPTVTPINKSFNSNVIDITIS